MTNEHDLLAGLLGTPGDDAGCMGGFALLAEYVEAELAGHDVRTLFPGVAAHLRNCPACSEDYRGLVALVNERQRALD